MAFKAQFNPAAGTGDWSITIPPEADMHDVLALGPVIEGVKDYLAPTVAPDKPVGYSLTESGCQNSDAARGGSYQLVERIDPDLTA